MNLFHFSCLKKPRNLHLNSLVPHYIAPFLLHLAFLCNLVRLLVIANVLPSLPILATVIIEAICSSETSVLTRRIQCNIPEDDIIHSHSSENLKSYIALTGWTLYWRHNVPPVKYELGFYIPEDDIPHSHCRENLKSDIALTGWTL
jgi:hypothetical protein